MRRLLPLCAVAICVGLAACAEAPESFLAVGTPAMPAGVPDLAPASFRSTCVRTPDLCDFEGKAETASTTATDLERTAPASDPTSGTAEQVEGSSPRMQLDDRSALRLLQKINGDVNGAMARDMRLLVNPADDWSPAAQTPLGLVGDCKSFAAEKRRRLLAAGFPADRLFYTVVFRENIGLHALLMAHLDQGDYALDSRQPWVTRWYDAAYIYVQRQAAGDQMRWTNLVSGPSSVAPFLLAKNNTPLVAAGAGSR